MTTTATEPASDISKEQPPASKRKSKFSFGLAFSALWGALLVFFFFLFMYDKSFKQKMFALAEEYGHPTPINVVLLILLETFLLMLGMSAAIPELLCAFFYKNYLLSFCVAAIARQMSTDLSYVIGRYLMKDLVDHYLREFKVYKIMVRMLEANPIKTLFLFRFSMLPNFIKYYGLPAMDVPFGKLNLVVLSTTLLQSHFYLLPGYLARSAYEIQSGQFTDRRAEYAIYASVVFYVIMLGFLVYYTKNEIKKIQEQDAKLATEVSTPLETKKDQ